MADKPVGFTLNQATISYLLGFAALVGLAFTVISWVNDREHYETTNSAAIIQLQTQDAAQIEANKELTGVVGRLSDSVDDLALSLKEVEVIQRTTPLTGLNVTPMPNLR